MSAQNSSPHLDAYIEILRGILVRIVEKNGKVQLSQEPVIQKGQILEYNKKMRVSALEKFNAPGHLSVINYYLTPKDKETKNAAGALILYILDVNIKKNFEALGQAVAGFDEDDPEQVAVKSGQFAQIISEEFCNELKAKGNKELIASEPMSTRNTFSDGIDFSYNQYEKCDVSFHIKKVKFMVLEITLGPLGK